MAGALLLARCGTPGSDNPEPVTQGYQEQYRPQYHFSPDSMWMNDPNGMVYYQGEYHLFYQHNPFDNVWGPMHWGHAISKDLVHWEHQPIALYPDSLGTIFSGSAVVDRDNTSGLGSVENPPMVAIFTYHNPRLQKEGSIRFESQGIAFSTDRGRTWTKYHRNPVVENPGIRDFRDPKVIWHKESKKWIMVLAAGDRVKFYSSPDLLAWGEVGEFTNENDQDNVWECPDLFPISNGLEEKWILLVSHGGAPNGGSGTLYYVGDFDGKKFRETNLPAGPQWIDYGKDNYAGVSWSDIPAEDGRRIFMGWMSNWEYANQVPTTRWRNAMTLPREMKLVNQAGRYRVHSTPVIELNSLRRTNIKLENITLTGIHPVDGVEKLPCSLYELELVFQMGIETQEEDSIRFGIILSNERGEQMLVSFDPGNKLIRMDRNHSGKIGFSEHFPGVHSAPWQTENGQLRINAFIDHSSLEIFIDNGSVVMSEICFPELPFNRISLFSENGTCQLKSGAIYGLVSAWQE